MAILPRYQRMRQRDWKDPFSWFNWFQIATTLTALISVARLAENAVARIAEDGTIRISE